jgi:hypothetical protein
VLRRVTLIGLAVALACVAPAAADTASLYRGPGPRPGPSLLYAKPAVAPQLTNAGPWKAAPILVSGASSYRSGEFVYQDFLYDDHGARGKADPGDKRSAGDGFSAPNGTYTYPTGPAYAGNAADLVELRIRPTTTATLFRLTFNTLKDPAKVAATLALGAGPATPVPFGANATAKADALVTWHGHTATLTPGAGDRNRPICAASATKATVDLRRRQVTLTVPHCGWDPGRSRVRISAGTGLWDTTHDAYLIPGDRADATHPGGAGGLTNPPAFFNLAFRHEPLPKIDLTAFSDPAWWRDRAQAHALAKHDLTAIGATVDFAKLARKAHDDSGVPRTGVLNRVLASHFEDGQGTNYAPGCGLANTRCTGELRGRLQPYALYVPPRKPRSGRYALTLLLHSLSASYNQFAQSENQSSFGARAGGSLVITPEGRGPDGFYTDRAEADTFEVWADVARHYRLRPDTTAIAGYSMGGFGTFRLAEQFPDLFARAQPTVGITVGDGSLLGSLRNIPLLIWNHEKDELVPYGLVKNEVATLDALGYRYELDTFHPAKVPPPTPDPNHLTLAVYDNFAPAARFLGDGRVVRNPPHVTYAYDPTRDSPRSRIKGGHAYWVSGIRLRAGAKLGDVDVVSHGFDGGDPVASPTRHGSGTLKGLLGTLTFSSQARSWSTAPKRARADRLVIRTTGVASLTVSAARARVSCHPKLTIHADGPLHVRIVGCPAH